MAPAEWFGFRKFGLVRGFDPFEFYGGTRSWKRDRRIIDTSAVAPASGLRRVRSNCGSLWQHACFWTSSYWRMDAPRLSSLLGSSGVAEHSALHGFVFDFAYSHDSDGSQSSGLAGRSAFETARVRPQHWCALRIQHVRRGGGCVARRNFSGQNMRASRYRIDGELRKLRCSRNSAALFRRRDGLGRGRTNPKQSPMAALVG